MLLPLLLAASLPAFAGSGPSKKDIKTALAGASVKVHPDPAICGNLTESLATVPLEYVQPGIRACYLSLLETDPAAAGWMGFWVTLTGSGKVDQAKLLDADPSLASKNDCYLKSVQERARWAPPPEGVDVGIRFSVRLVALDPDAVSAEPADADAYGDNPEGRPTADGCAAPTAPKGNPDGSATKAAEEPPGEAVKGAGQKAEDGGGGPE